MSPSPDTQLEEILKLLVERFGSERSLGEAYATCHALRMVREGRDFSVSDIARATGLPKQNLSRWLKYQVSIGQANTRASEDDARRQQIGITDPAWAFRHLERAAEIFGCDLDTPRRR
jgi:DNA-binding MarR family transcriptional regulator